MTDLTFAKLHDKLNFLLTDHGVKDFDETGLDLESVASMHAKANALCAAHGGNPDTMSDDTLADLHPKLDFLLNGHGVDFDATGLGLETIEAVDAKVSAIVQAHHDGH